MKVGLAILVLTISEACLGLYYHPYLNKPSEEIDSDEHGLGKRGGLMGTVGTDCRCGWSNKVTQRVVGGKQTGVNQFPWTIGITPKRRLFIFCGGTIVTKRHAVTAAHCIADKMSWQIDVIVGEHNVQRTWETDATEVIGVSQIVKHSRYSPENDNDDIALLALEKDIIFTDEVGPACMPKSRHQFDLVDKYIKVMGWGLTSTGGSASPYLKHTNLRVIPLEHCKKSFRAYISTINPTQLCTFSKRRDACQGDSGGPIVHLDPVTNLYTLVGVVSYGAECGEVTPGVNTEVAAYVDWIQSNIRLTSRYSDNIQTCQRL